MFKYRNFGQKNIIVHVGTNLKMNNLTSSASGTYPLCGAVYAWMPFAFFIIFSLAFSVTYVFYFWKKREKDRFSCIVSILALFITLLSVFLLPVDVFLVSFMKRSDGTFKEWATNETEENLKDNMTFAYYNFYSAIVVLAFFVLPLAYFASEENDDQDTCFRVVSALRYTSVFFLFAVIFIIIGAFLPYEHFHIPRNQTDNLTSWEQIKLVFNEIEKNRGIDALSFVLNILTVVGMLGIIAYTALGMSSFTIGNIRGWRSRKEEKKIIVRKRTQLEHKINEYKNKEDSMFLSAHDLQQLQSLEEELRYTVHVQRKVELPDNRLFQICNDICLARGCTFVVGLLGACFGVLLWTSLFIVNLEKAIRSFGFESGYFIDNLKWFNPLNFIMLQILKAFPLDFVLYFCMIIFLIFCTVSGLRYIGIWCFCIRIFKVRPRRTEPQALIMLCGILIYVVLALNVLMYETMPQYTTFGNQHYRLMPANITNSTKVQILPCDFNAPKGECIMTRASTFIISFSVKASFFAVVYYYFTWLFLIAVLVGFFVVVFAKKKSIVDERIDKDDFDESDDDGPLIT